MAEEGFEFGEAGVGADLVKALEDFMPGESAFGNQFALHVGKIERFASGPVGKNESP